MILQYNQLCILLCNFVFNSIASVLLCYYRLMFRLLAIATSDLIYTFILLDVFCYYGTSSFVIAYLDASRVVK